MELIQRQTSLSANIVAFCRFLRQKGYTIGPQEEADALRALEELAPFGSPESLQLCLKAILARTLPQQMLFDGLYTQYWRELEKAVNAKVKEGAPEKKPTGRQQQQQPRVQSIKTWLQGSQAEETEEMAAYSTHEAIGRKDFSSFREDNLWEATRLIHRIARSLALRQSRRRKRSSRPIQLDLRRTLRLNMRRGGEIMDLAYYEPAENKQQIVLLCDVSKSMDLYSRFLIQFVYAFQKAYRRIETFVFSTSLYRVTSQLRQRDFSIALNELADAVPGWSGGTKIGESLHEFCASYAGKLLNNRTVVIIMSDGWDTGNTELLSESMRIIQSRSAKVIWLNPLAGSSGYEPNTLGLQAAMPHIDIFAPAHNVESLRELYRYLR
ncbi:MAG: VWA domain-containing protein [Phaeodactylibacter sp.]|nr:VWA domain-containing protein [Phaeodactylibacter sp.]